MRLCVFVLGEKGGRHPIGTSTRRVIKNFKVYIHICACVRACVKGFRSIMQWGERGYIRGKIFFLKKKIMPNS